MTRLPDVVFIIDVRKEEIAVAEANRLGIPVVAVVDTNCSPEGIDYVIPGNDDALRAVRLFAARIADAVLEGQQMVTEGAAEEGETAAATARPAGEAAETAPATEGQVSAPGRQGFGATGQQPDGISDSNLSGTGAPVAGASGAGDSSAEAASSSPESDKGAESVGVAS
jgi:hypothetical protein